MSVTAFACCAECGAELEPVDEPAGCWQCPRCRETPEPLEVGFCEDCGAKLEQREPEFCWDKSWWCPELRGARPDADSLTSPDEIQTVW